MPAIGRIDSAEKLQRALALAEQTQKCRATRIRKAFLARVAESREQLGRDRARLFAEYEAHLASKNAR